MATETGRVHELLNGLMWVACVFGALMIFAGVLRVAFGLIDARKLAHPRLCDDGRTRDCLDAYDGRVVSVGEGNVVYVASDAGNARFEVRGKARPHVEANVRVELWDGQPVSFTDPQGRRYKDDVLWPAGSPPWVPTTLVLGAALIAPVTARKVVRVRRSRRR